MELPEVNSTEDALAIGNAMMDAGIFEHVTRDHPLKDEDMFYRFNADSDEFHGGCATPAQLVVIWEHEAHSPYEILHVRGPSFRRGKDESGQQVSWGAWAEYLITGGKIADRSGLQAKLPEYADATALEMDRVTNINVSPLDAYNVQLLDNVHPAKWINPEPQPRWVISDDGHRKETTDPGTTPLALINSTFIAQPLLCIVFLSVKPLSLSLLPLSFDVGGSIMPYRMLVSRRGQSTHDRARIHRYNMVVIGAGAGGLVSSSIAAGLGGKAAIIEVTRPCSPAPLSPPLLMDF